MSPFGLYGWNKHNMTRVHIQTLKVKTTFSYNCKGIITKGFLKLRGLMQPVADFVVTTKQKKVTIKRLLH